MTTFRDSKGPASKLTEDIFIDSFLPRSNTADVFAFVSLLLSEKLTLPVFTKLISKVVDAHVKQVCYLQIEKYHDRLDTYQNRDSKLGFGFCVLFL